MDSDLPRNRVKERLARDEIAATMAVRLVRGVEIARIAATAGLDSIYIDLEHAMFGAETTGQICLAALDMGITPLIRLPANRPEYIARAFEGGAMGIIAPHVRSAEEARAIVDAAKFAPLGSRGVASLSPLTRFRSYPNVEAMAFINALTMVIVMIESGDGVAQVKDIVAVEGVDVAFIGAVDLAADLGIPGAFDHPRLHEAISAVITACRRAGKHAGLGGLAARPDLMKTYAAMGARFLSTGADLNFLLAAAQQRARAAHALLTE